MTRAACGVLAVLVMVGFGLAQEAGDPDADGVVAGSGVPSQEPQVGGTIPDNSGFTFIAVGWHSTESCPVGSIDTNTGAWTDIGPIGGMRCNSMARNSVGVLHTITATGSGGDGSALTSIDPLTGAGTVLVPLSPGLDARGLAFSASDVLYVVVDATPSDQLWTIDTATGNATVIGEMGDLFTAVQALAFDYPTGTLYATDNVQGLLTVDTGTGVATDPFPGVGGTGDVQTISITPDGTFWGAGDDLWTIDPGTGVFTMVATGGYPDVRGIDLGEPIPVELMSFTIE